jgi:anti-sigma factor RsiW
MNHPHPTDDVRPRPELLAGYLDGELDEPARRALATWLMDHPEAAAELAGHARVLQVYAEAALQEPSEMAWRGAFAEIEERLSADAGPAAPSPRRWPVRAAAILAAAATLLVALYAGISWRSDRDLDELVVAESNEVDITSMEAKALDAVVVGETPVRDPLELATTDDIRVHRFNPVARNRFSIVGTSDDDDDDGGFAMLVALK